MMEGITLRDYFMAHAPAEPQLWFAPEMPEPPKFVIKPDNLTDEESRQIEGVLEGYLDIWEVDEPRVKEWAAASDAYYKAKKKYDTERAKQLYVQWPAAWADAMLAEINNKGGAA